MNRLETAPSRADQVFNDQDFGSFRQIAFNLVLSSMFLCLATHIDKGKAQRIR